MATVTPTLTLASTNLLTDALSFTTTTSTTASHTNGLRRDSLTSVDRVNRLTCVDGDAALTIAGFEGQFIDITDNHGLTKRYVIIDGTNSTVATGDILTASSDLGSDTVTNLGKLEVVGGIAVDIPNSTTQANALTVFKAAIEHANGHNGSITVAAVSGTSDGPQNLTMTNAVVGESAAFLIDADGSNIGSTFLDNTKDAAATNSAANHPIIVPKNQFSSPAFVYLKNTSSFNTSTNRVFLYYDNHAAEEIIELRGGEFAYIPLNVQNNLKAYTSTSATILESMVFGTNA